METLLISKRFEKISRKDLKGRSSTLPERRFPSSQSPLIPLRSPCKLKVDDFVDSTFALLLFLFLINIWITKLSKYALKTSSSFHRASKAEIERNCKYWESKVTFCPYNFSRIPIFLVLTRYSNQTKEAKLGYS